MKARKVAPWKWNHGHNLEDLMTDTTSTRHGNIITGKQSLLDIPKDEDLRKRMPLPWMCPKCGNGHLMYVLKCNRCGYPTPLGDENWRA